MAQKKSILVLGTGHVSTSLIAYLLDEYRAKKENWHILIADCNRPSFVATIEQSKYGEFILLDIKNKKDSHAVIERATVVISLLPVPFHTEIAKICLELDKHLFTASYTSEAMQAMHEAAKSKNLLFMNECGLDPGLDHMIAMQIIDDIKEKSGKIVSLKSFAGGLISPDTDLGNPWRYKFMWHPQSIIKAGQGHAKFLHNGQPKYVPYWKVFKQTSMIEIPNHGKFVGYLNRDSIKYIKLYELNGIDTMVRSTLRIRGFCAGWNVFVQLGCTEDTHPVEQVDTMTHRDFIELFLPTGKPSTIAERVAAAVGLPYPCPELDMIDWLGCFDEEKIGLSQGTPAQILEHILNKKWKVGPGDRDMVVMWLECRYTLDNKHYARKVSLIYMGDPHGDTAMAKGVGLPLGIATKLFLQGRIQQRGVCLPTSKAVYIPMLKELASFGIQVEEKDAIDTDAG